MSLLPLVFFQGAAGDELPAEPACQETQRIELTLAPDVSREVCISVGRVTDLRFDSAFKMDLQEEPRFEEALRGRQLLSLLPPADMAPGERFRLQVHLLAGTTQQHVTLTLVAHQGQSTRQVDVYRDTRTRDSFLEQIEQDALEKQRLRADNQLLLSRWERASELRWLVTRPVIHRGLKTETLDQKVLVPTEGVLSFNKGTSYRATHMAALDLRLKNLSPEPWRVAGASLVNARGEELKEVKFLQEEDIASSGIGSVSLDVPAEDWQARGEWTLKLWDERGRGITLPRVTFP